ncbi:MAG: hypothetical protein AAFW00_28860 [Bacteroidota bacterium]
MTQNIFNIFFWISGLVGGCLLLAMLCFSILAYHEIGFLPDDPSDFSVYGYIYRMDPEGILPIISGFILQLLGKLFLPLSVFAYVCFPIALILAYFQLFRKGSSLNGSFWFRFIIIHMYVFFLLQPFHGIGVDIYCFECWYWD